MRPQRRRPRPRPQSGAPSGPSTGPVVELIIDAVGGEGDGMAVGPVFVPFTLPGERVTAQGSGERRDLVEVLVPSADRIAAACPHFTVCGGCALQHWSHAPYLAWKVERMVGTLARERVEAEILPPFAADSGTRRRVTLHARRGDRDSARLGYKARKSWDLVDIDVCPIADPAIQAALPMLKRLAARLFEHPKSAPSLHVTLTDTGLDIDITGVEARDLVRRPLLAHDLRHTDVAVFDPPRAGAAEQAAELAGSKVSRVIGVSCNPATFARDARTLIDAGFRLERILPVDQFLWSPHIELVGVFNR